MKTVLVTGAAGFVGAHVVSELLQRGHRVSAVEHRTRLPKEVRANCRTVSGDIRDAKFLKTVLRNVDVVCHLCAHVPRNLCDPSEAEACYTINALATLDLAREAADQAVQRFVYASTGSVYAVGTAPRSESDRAFPDKHATFYSASKLCGEIYLSNVGLQCGMESLTLRLGAPYGPGSPERSVVSTFMRCAATGESLRLQNGGLSRYNFIWVKDAAHCLAEAVECGPPGIYNVASGEHTSLRSLADAVLYVYGKREMDIRIEPHSQDVAGLPALSIDKAQRTWAFKPLGLSAGLARYRDSISGYAG